MTFPLILTLVTLILSLQATECRFSQDHLGIDLMLDAAQGTGAATTPGAFSASVGSGQEWINKVSRSTLKLLNSVEPSICLN